MDIDLTANLCLDTCLALPKSFALVDNEDSASMFTTV